jgi:hypothetical protein
MRSSGASGSQSTKRVDASSCARLRGLHFEALTEVANLIADTIFYQLPQPPWWPYRWVRVLTDPLGRCLEVSDAEENPWR